MSKRAYTFMEVMLAMGIMAIMVVLGFQGIQILQRNSRDTSRTTTGEEMVSIINEYRRNRLRYPEDANVVFTANQFSVNDSQGFGKGVDLEGFLEYDPFTTNESQTRYEYTRTRSGFQFCVYLENGDVESLGLDNC